MPTDDSLSARIPTSCPEEIRQILLHAWSHDLTEIKKLVDSRETASIQDPQTGETPLHAAIRACGPSEAQDEEDDGVVGEAKEVVQELFMTGAIWNDVDSNNETPGCVALRLGRTSLYDMCVDAGVRAELLFALMDGYEQLSSDAGDDEDEEMEEDKPEEATNDDEAPELVTLTDSKPKFTPPETNDKPITSEQYLNSKLTFDSEKVLDADMNGVMMSWETDIMKRSVAALIPNLEPGKKVLNIGFGMGIVDGIFADTKPARHHIIEAHPDVLEQIAKPESKFGADWEKSGPEEGAYKVWKGKWQDIVPQLLEQGEQYDAIYFDTFGEDYSQLRMLLMEYVPGVMDLEGRFSFFNGLGADRRICYDVYTKVVEMHASDAGLDVEWEVIDVDMKDLGEEGKGDWDGVRRRYWTLDSKFDLDYGMNHADFATEYRLPVFTFMG